MTWITTFRSSYHHCKDATVSNDFLPCFVFVLFFIFKDSSRISLWYGNKSLPFSECTYYTSDLQTDLPKSIRVEFVILWRQWDSLVSETKDVDGKKRLEFKWKEWWAGASPRLVSKELGLNDVSFGGFWLINYCMTKLDKWMPESL